MQERTRFVIKHPEGYLNKMANDVTHNLFAAISFNSHEEAHQWMQGIYGPKEAGFEIVETLTTIKEVHEHVQQK